jgi:hypothetical protein
MRTGDLWRILFIRSVAVDILLIMLYLSSLSALEVLFKYLLFFPWSSTSDVLWIDFNFGLLTLLVRVFPKSGSFALAISYLRLTCFSSTSTNSLGERPWYTFSSSFSGESVDSPDKLFWLFDPFAPPPPPIPSCPFGYCKVWYLFPLLLAVPCCPPPTPPVWNIRRF